MGTLGSVSVAILKFKARSFSVGLALASVAAAILKFKIRYFCRSGATVSLLAAILIFRDTSAITTLAEFFGSLRQK